MSDSILTVKCGDHGQRVAATVCRHVLNNQGAALGFIENSSEPDDLQGWCYACEYVFSEEQALNDRFRDFNQFALVCCECYQGIKAHHREKK